MQGRQESSPNTSNNDVVPPQNSGNSDVVPYPELSDRDRTILEEILKDNHVLLDKIRALEPAFLDGLRKIKPAVPREMVFDPAELDPVIVDAIRKLSLKGGKEEGEENENGNLNETKSEERDEERSRSLHYPVGHGARDCLCYLETGTCKFGPNCKFNHPRIITKNNQNKMKEREGLAEKPGKTECKISKARFVVCFDQLELNYYRMCFHDTNYFRSGGCKPGKAFSFNPRRGEPSVAPVQKLNFMDLPIRPGAKECPYYMKNGSCKSGTNCTFNHPDPTAIGESGPPSGYIDGGPASVQGASSATAWDSLCMPMIPPSQGIPCQNTEWNASQDPEYLPERSIPAPPPYVMNKAVTETNIYEQNPQQKQVEEFPERPGQPICIYFLRKGDCKHRSNCKYHHPKNQTAVSPHGENICTQYSSYGICNSGPACKFDHPSLSTFLL
ncbi:Zinc finger C-x8-C-x5-C-x3-H type family protein [Prunus dulcis]|uniref:Zinc finger C-x8-C-x5-C-x3-H type family protein n=1 Tax=Prunus dulcis TaxID=3755 RepID=A0A5H2XSW5_PRUDU|nr:Zinc finger C-x8-C-x5-C-x3-H type family protein [Prunus dulcis]